MEEASILEPPDGTEILTTEILTTCMRLLSNPQINFYAPSYWDFKVYLLEQAVLITLIEADYMPTWGKAMHWPDWTSSEMELDVWDLLTTCNFTVRIPEIFNWRLEQLKVQNIKKKKYKTFIIVLILVNRKLCIYTHTHKHHQEDRCLCRYTLRCLKVFKNKIYPGTCKT